MIPHPSSSSLLCALPASLSISEHIVCTSCSSVCRGSFPSFAIDDRAYGAFSAILLTGGPPPRDLPEKKPAKGLLPLSAAGVRPVRLPFLAQAREGPRVGPREVVLAGLIRHHEPDILLLVHVHGGDGGRNVRPTFIPVTWLRSTRSNDDTRSRSQLKRQRYIAQSVSRRTASSRSCPLTVPEICGVRTTQPVRNSSDSSAMTRDWRS